MIELKRLKLINWHNFENTTFDCARLTYMIGVNAVGKTTILDAIRYCLTTNRNFNALGNKKSGRTLQGSVHAKQRGENAYRRPGHTVAYIGAEFWDSVKHTSFVIAVRVESEGPMQELHPGDQTWYISEDGITLEQLPFIDPRTGAPSAKEDFKPAEGRLSYTRSPSEARDRICRALGIGRASSPLGKKFNEVFQMGTSMDEIPNFREFLYQYILPQPELDLEALQGDRLELENLHAVLAEAQTRADALEEIVRYGREATEKQTEALVNRGAALLARAAADAGEKAVWQERVDAGRRQQETLRTRYAEAKTAEAEARRAYLTAHSAAGASGEGRALDALNEELAHRQTALDAAARRADTAEKAAEKTGNLLAVLRRQCRPKAPRLFTALGLAMTTLLPLLHIALYRGMPDLLGVAFALMLLALGIGYDFSAPAPARLVSMAAFTGLLMLTRRSYMFTVVAFFLLYGVWVLARAARARQVQTALRFGRFAAASLVCVGVPLLPMFWRIAKADYSDRYATYQTGGFLAELANQRVYLGWLVFVIMLIGILYGLYNAKARALAVLAAVGAVLTVLLVTRVQNMDDHQSLAVAPFYLLGCFLCALLVSDLPWAWPRRILAVSAGVLCALNFGACSQLLPVVFPSGFYSGLYFYVDSPRNDLQQVAEVNAWLRENCTGENSAYMICHGVVYSPDVFRISALPDESIREILPYGACNPGNDAFPKELLTAQVVLTCTPFDPNNHTEKMNAAFLENQEKYAPFELAATFDMGNGYTITAYRRVKAPTAAELDTYRAYLAEENERFPYNFSAVWDALAVQFANNG